MADDVSSTLFSLLRGIEGSLTNPLSSRMVARDGTNGLIVSTVWTADQGYETAILHKSGVHPVERYGSREEASAGHRKWLARATAGLSEVEELGYGVLGSRRFVLVPMSEEEVLLEVNVQ